MILVYDTTIVSLRGHTDFMFLGLSVMNSLFQAPQIYVLTAPGYEKSYHPPKIDNHQCLVNLVNLFKAKVEISKIIQ